MATKLQFDYHIILAKKGWFFGMLEKFIGIKDDSDIKILVVKVLTHKEEEESEKSSNTDDKKDEETR